MMIVSFAYTTPSFIAGRKTKTRREWTPEYARRFKVGDVCKAYDRQPRFGGTQIGIIKIKSLVYEDIGTMPDEDYEKEGFSYLSEIGEKIWNKDPWTAFNDWKNAGGNYWILEFEVLDLHKDKNNPMYGKKHTKEACIKMSLNHSNSSGVNNSMWGKHHTEEAKRKISEMCQGKYVGEKNPMWGVHRYGEDAPTWNKHHTEEAKKKMSIAKKGKSPWSKGKKGIFSEETLKKMSAHRKGKTYEEIYGPVRGKELREKMKEVFRKRDDPRLKRHGIITYPKLRFSEKLGHNVRSSWEEEIGLMLKNAGISYEYETRKLSFGNGVYIPDFVINPNLYIEVKGKLFDKKRDILLKIQELYPNMVLIGVGDGNDKVYDIHIEWSNRKKLIDVLSELKVPLRGSLQGTSEGPLRREPLLPCNDAVHK